MWAHAAALSPIYSNLKERFYQQARECVEDSEVEVSGGSMTIAALQTHILLALYEFKETLFPRAWTSVSRATWLAQMLELHKMDPKVSSKRVASFETYLHETSDPAELKERATTLWAAYGLHCFIGVGVGWNTGCMLDVREVSQHAIHSGVADHWHSFAADKVPRSPRTYRHTIPTSTLFRGHSH